jgi:hypothetical protein
MCKFAIFVGFAAICIAFGRFLLTPLFSAESVDCATGLLHATGLFTIAISAVVRK